MTRERRLSFSTGALAVLLAALGLYVYLVEVRGGEKREREQQAVTHLFPFPAAPHPLALAPPHPLPPSSAPVLVVERPARDAAEKKLYDLRDKTVLDFSPDDVNGINYTDGSTTVRLVRQPGTGDDPQAGWKLVQPGTHGVGGRVRSDRGAVERPLNLLAS